MAEWLAALRADRPTGSYLTKYQPFCVELHDALLWLCELAGLCLEPNEKGHTLTYIFLIIYFNIIIVDPLPPL
jgi:hypothetical protein